MGMAALHTTATVGAVADRDVERPAKRIRSFLYKKFFFVIFVNLRVFVVPSAVYYLREERDMILPLVLALTVQSAPASGRAIQEGKKLFDGMCARCHGIDGTGDEGPALNRATLARAASDDALRDVIRDGIPERGMPRVRRLSDGELAQLVAYVRSLGRAGGPPARGDAERGRAVYARLGCASC